MKKLLLASASLMLLSAPALAQDANNNGLSDLSGFYVGGFAGYGWNDVDAPAGVLDGDVDGGDFGIFAGYKVDALLDATVNKLGLGLNGAIEAHYAWSTADDTVAGGLVDYDKNHEWGISFRPGLSFISENTPFGLNPYGIIGYREAEFEASALGASVDEDFSGFELGIGTELIAYGDYGVRLDYSHVFYEEKDDFQPSSDEIRLGIGYHF